VWVGGCILWQACRGDELEAAVLTWTLQCLNLTRNPKPGHSDGLEAAVLAQRDGLLLLVWCVLLVQMEPQNPKT
jgi:hypothetical protein